MIVRPSRCGLASYGSGAAWLVKRVPDLTRSARINLNARVPLLVARHPVRLCTWHLHDPEVFLARSPGDGERTGALWTIPKIRARRQPRRANRTSRATSQRGFVSGSVCGSKSTISSGPRRTIPKRSSVTNERSRSIENDRGKPSQSGEPELEPRLGDSLAFVDSHRSKALNYRTTGLRPGLAPT